MYGEHTTDCEGVYTSMESALVALNKASDNLLNGDEYPSSDFKKFVDEDEKDFFFTCIDKDTDDRNYIYQCIIEKEVIED